MRVPQKTSTCFSPRVRIRCDRISRFFSRGTGCTMWLTRSATALRAAICTSAGLTSSVLVSLRISSGKVAENSRFCLTGGSSAMMRLMSGMKPMSSMRSASSRISTDTWLNITVLLCTWSSSRPGVATRISTPLRSAAICAFMSEPP